MPISDIRLDLDASAEPGDGGSRSGLEDFPIELGRAAQTRDLDEQLRPADVKGWCPDWNGRGPR